MSSRRHSHLAFIAFFGLLVACDRDRDRVGTTTLTGGVAAFTTDTAVERLVQVRCTRDASCDGGVAAGQPASRDACEQKLRPLVRRRLAAADCPEGFGPKEIEICVHELLEESCVVSVDDIEHIAACRARELCLKGTGAPYRLME